MRFVLGRDSFDIGRPGIDSSSPPCEPDECTIVRRNGEVCGQPVCDDTSVSVCDHHATLRIDHALVLAIEPGAYEVESRRLAQFKHLRFGRREDFEIGDDLIQHIKAIREKYGPPSFEQDPFGLVARLNAG